MIYIHNVVLMALLVHVYSIQGLFFSSLNINLYKAFAIWNLILLTIFFLHILVSRNRRKFPTAYFAAIRRYLLTLLHKLKILVKLWPAGSTILKEITHNSKVDMFWICPLTITANGVKTKQTQNFPVYSIKH